MESSTKKNIALVAAAGVIVWLLWKNKAKVKAKLDSLMNSGDGATGGSTTATGTTTTTAPAGNTGIVPPGYTGASNSIAPGETVGVVLPDKTILSESPAIAPVVAMDGAVPMPEITYVEAGSFGEFRIGFEPAYESARKWDRVVIELSQDEVVWTNISSGDATSPRSVSIASNYAPTVLNRAALYINPKDTNTYEGVVAPAPVQVYLRAYGVIGSTLSRKSMIYPLTMKNTAGGVSATEFYNN